MVFFRYYTAFVLLVFRVSSLEMNHGSFCIIHVIRCGRRHEMKCQKESVKKLTQKSVEFHFFGLLTESTVLFMFRKAAYIIQHSFAILSYQVCSTELLYIPEENHSKVYTSTSTMCVRTMQRDPLNVFAQKRSSGYRTRLPA
jgi:hypothetical protein